MGTRTINVGSTYPATQLVYPGDGAVLFYNTDSINPVWVGDNNAMEAGDTLNTIQVPAGTSFGVDGKSPLYGISNPGTSVAVDLLTGGTQFNTGITSSIQMPQFLVTEPPVAPGSGGGPYSVTFPPGAQGYQIEALPSNPFARTFACDLQINHVDSFGVTVFIERYTLSNWSGNAQPSIIRGRLVGQSLLVAMTVATASFINTITGAATTADSISLRFYSLSSYAPGLSKRSPIVGQSNGLLLGSFQTAALPATNGTTVIITALPDYSGPVIIAGNTITAGLSFVPRIDSYTVAGGTTPISRLELPAITPTTGVVQPASLPSCFNVAYVKQVSTTAANAGFSVIVDSTEL